MCESCANQRRRRVPSFGGEWRTVVSDDDIKLMQRKKFVENSYRKTTIETLTRILIFFIPRIH